MVKLVSTTDNHISADKKLIRNNSFQSTANGLNGANIQHVRKPVELDKNQELEHAPILLHQAVEVTVRVQRQKQQTVIQQRVVLTIIAVHDNSSKLFGLCLDKMKVMNL